VSGKESQQFQLGDWLVEPELGRVSRGEQRASLRPREMDLLVYFAARPREVLKTDDIIRDVWSGVHVTNDSLYFSISQLRKVLDQTGTAGSVIETIPKRGYRLMADVSTIDHGQSDAVEPAAGGSTGVEGSAGDTVDRAPPRSGPDLRRTLAIAAVLIAAAGLVWLSFAGGPAQSPSASSQPPTIAQSMDARSIAVMPFIDLTPETDYTYFSDGITEEILNRLTRITTLRVAARTSSFTFKDSGADVTEIGRSLGVANLLEGSVRKEGDRVRVSVQLIDAVSGFQLWSNTYDRQLTSVFEIQNEISRHVADALEITLAGNEADGGKAAQPATPDALDEYLMGLEAIRTQSFESLARAVDHFETVLELDPSFSAARVQLATAHLEMLNTGASNDVTRARVAETLLQAVIAEEPGNAAAHRVMGKAQKFLGNPGEALRELNLALQMAPSDSEAMVHLAHLMSSRGEAIEARELMAQALQLDPFSSNVLRSYAVMQRQFGATDIAERAMERATELHPDNPNHFYILGSLQAEDRGNIALGLDNFRLAAQLDPADYEIAAYVSATYLTLGLRDEATPFIQRADDTGPRAMTTLAVHAMRAMLDGRTAEAREISLDALEQNSMRIYTHSVITSTFLPMIVSDAIQSGELEEAIARLEAAKASQKLVQDELAQRAGLDALLAFSDLSRTWLVSLAVLYKAAGMEQKLDNALDGLALTRIHALGEYRDAIRNDDYLVEAEVLALEGKVDDAFAMLELAVDNNLIYMWQFNYANNPAFDALRDDPRWEPLMARVESRIGEERQLVTATLGMVRRADEAN